MQIIFYMTATGEIDFVQEYDDDTTTLPGDVDADTPVGDSWIVGDGEATPEFDYVLSGVQTERPVIATDFTLDAVADGTTVLTVAAAMPIGTVVTFEDNDTTLLAVEDVEFVTEIMGPFQIYILPPFPYQPGVFEISANQA